MNKLIHAAHRFQPRYAGAVDPTKGKAWLVSFGLTTTQWAALDAAGRAKFLQDRGIAVEDIPSAVADINAIALPITAPSPNVTRTPVSYTAPAPNNTPKYLVMGAAALLLVWWATK